MVLLLLPFVLTSLLAFLPGAILLDFYVGITSASTAAMLADEGGDHDGKLSGAERLLLLFRK